jgi:hypothetical protein
MPDSSPSTGTWREHHPLAFEMELSDRLRQAEARVKVGLAGSISLEADGEATTSSAASSR